ncbi:MAG: hypothetical protein ABEJ86_04215 [Halococcoides sp.]
MTIETVDCHPEVEAKGQYLLSFLESTEDVLPALRRRTEDILAANGIEEVDPTADYRVVDVARAFRDVADSLGERTVRRGGEQMGRDIPFPPPVDSPQDALAALDQIHRDACRLPAGADPVKAPAGGYEYAREDDESARIAITDRYPFPSVMAEGLVAGVVNRYTDTDTTVDIESVAPESSERAAWLVSWTAPERTERRSIAEGH